MSSAAENKENGAKGRGQLRYRTGVVASEKMQQTVVVSITRQVRHSRYGKIVKRTSKLYAHDTKNECKLGDTVEVVESRPISKLKRWRVHRVITRAVV